MAPDAPKSWVVPFIVLTLGACADHSAQRDAGRSDVHSEDVRIELGSGQLHWEDLPPDAHVELIHGPQGGYHLFARVRFDRLGPAVSVSFRVTPAHGGAALNDPTDRLRLAEGRGLVFSHGTWESNNVLLVVLTTITSQASAAALLNQRIRFEVTVTSSDTGRSATTAREVVVVDDT